MPDDKPKYAEYRDWLTDKRGSPVTDALQNRYDTNVRKAREAFAACDCWATAAAGLRELEDQYKAKTGYPLLAYPAASIELVTKPFDSFLLKTYRKNILYNANYPEEPEGGWYLPSASYSRIRDLVRTNIVVKYLDGVTELVDHLASACDTYGVRHEVQLEAKTEGYYAAHFYFSLDVPVLEEDWDAKLAPMSLEVQVNTQLQDVIRKLTHKFYEIRREKTEPSEEAWQWDYKSERFTVNYLGHMLQFLEGVIMSVRDEPEAPNE